MHRLALTLITSLLAGPALASDGGGGGGGGGGDGNPAMEQLYGSVRVDRRWGETAPRRQTAPTRAAAPTRTYNVENPEPSWVPRAVRGFAPNDPGTIELVPNSRPRQTQASPAPRRREAQANTETVRVVPETGQRIIYRYDATCGCMLYVGAAP